MTRKIAPIVPDHWERSAIVVANDFHSMPFHHDMDPSLIKESQISKAIPPRQSPRVLLALCLVFLLMGLVTLRAQPGERLAPFARVPLQKPMRGADALKNMADRMAEIAAFHRMNEPELRALLRRDRSLWLDREGQLFFVC